MDYKSVLNKVNLNITLVESKIFDMRFEAIESKF